MENEQLIDFLKESGKGLWVEGNVIHAEKAFMIRSVIDWCLDQRDAGTMSDGQVQVYIKMINQFVEGTVFLFWDAPGRLGVTKKVRKDKGTKNDE